MAENDKLTSALAEHRRLLADRARRTLSREEEQRMAMLMDLLLEASAELEARQGDSKRARAWHGIELEIAFQLPADAARSYGADVGTGGLALQTARPLPVGAEVLLKVVVPGWNTPLGTEAAVVWERPGAMGLAFRHLHPDDRRRLEELVVEHTSLGARLVGALSPKKAIPVAARVSNVIRVALELEEELARTCAGLIDEEGFLVLNHQAGQTPDILVADPRCLKLTEAPPPSCLIVLVNTSGPDALVGRLGQLRVAAFIARPASPESILQIVRTLGRVL